jgi:DNA-directed RNA polymerase specialized sigma24 family protein
MADERTVPEKTAIATMLLMLEQRTPEQRAAERDELVLQRAGFTAPEIAELLGKQPAAVRMAISRAKRGRTA